MAVPERVKHPSVFSDPNPALNSLFGEILDWMLAPLLLVWPISIAATHHIADEIANQPYDYVLADQVGQIVRNLKITPDGVTVSLPKAASARTVDDDSDKQYRQVAVAGGDVIAGDEEVPPLPAGSRRAPGEVLFRSGDVMGERVRIAYQLLPLPADARPLLVQVAETRQQRSALSSRIIAGVLLPQFAIIPLAVILVWVGLTRGLAPLTRLQSRIRERRPDDLSPIELRTVPEELRPMVGAFNDMMLRLQDNLDAQQRFIAAAAHQLKTPLTGLKTQVELALQENDGKQLPDYLQRIAAGVDRASHLTYQLLQLARAEASHEKPRALEPLDLDALVREVMTHCVPRALARNIDLGFEEAGAEIKIIGVPLLLREMIDNLVDNAIKYTPSGGHVTVRLHAFSDPVLEVEDSGIGIAGEDRQRIFDRFFRALGTDAEGSGLGLAIVREIADLHRAGIEVLDNPQGQGTLIRLVFANTKA
ncbi:MAG: sensor histidine kinase N-terminal domain-containing protein [Rhodocyclaceae bacterium]|nr:sensor histidine kinase N-terminal domain-containing protein [Rhodocyclaceae bacterium]